MKRHADQLKFRAWLVRQLELTRWSAPADLPLPALAQELGVTLPVLEEAIARRESALQRAGKPRRVRGKRLMDRSDYAILRVTMPGPVHTDWQEYVRVLRTSPSTLFRSLVHSFLLAPIRPTTTTRSWLYRGGTYQLESSGLRRKRQGVVTRITRGAQIALDHHASLWNVPPTYIARGLIVDLLEGRALRRLKIVTYPELWGDPDRYLHPEKFS